MLFIFHFYFIVDRNKTEMESTKNSQTILLNYSLMEIIYASNNLTIYYYFYAF